MKSFTKSWQKIAVTLSFCFAIMAVPFIASAAIPNNPGGEVYVCYQTGLLGGPITQVIDKNNGGTCALGETEIELASTDYVDQLLAGLATGTGYERINQTWSIPSVTNPAAGVLASGSLSMACPGGKLPVDGGFNYARWRYNGLPWEPVTADSGSSPAGINLNSPTVIGAGNFGYPRSNSWLYGSVQSVGIPLPNVTYDMEVSTYIICVNP